MSPPGLPVQDGPNSSVAAGHRRGAVLIPVLAVLLLSAVVAAAAVISKQWTLNQATQAIPGEGLYWSVAQYQIAHQRLKQELRATAAGEPANHEVIAQRWAVLASRASILGEPSALHTLLGDVSGFAQASKRITDLHQRIAPLLDRPQPLTKSEAQQVLLAFRNADDEALVGQLGNDARQAELDAKELTGESLNRRLTWVWAGFGLCWAVLALWLLHAVRSGRRFALAADERQRALDAMQQAITAKRSFVSMVSHELRSPLQSIVTAAESLSHDIALGQSRPQSAGAIRRIRHAVTGLQAQLRDLLTIARSDTGFLGLQLETFECSALVTDICADFEDAALARGLTLNVSLPDQPHTVQADPIRIAQVLRNLLENAVRYTPAGRVDVQLLPVDDSFSTASTPCMRFTVSDTGPGLPLAAQERLTSAEPAFAPSHQNPEDGLRIGLFVIRDVLRQLGGRIEISSVPGQGTQVSVEIPVAAAAEAADAAPTRAVIAANTNSANASADALHILVVDDRTDVLEALRASAHQLGHRCDVAISADAAAPRLASTRYDTVLVDLQMPDKSGLDLAREIRSSTGPNARSMLILISAPDNQAVGLLPPFDGFLAKPVSAQDLRGLIGLRTRH